MRENSASGTNRTVRAPAYFFRFVPNPDVSQRLFDHLVGAGEERGCYGEAERLGGFEVDQKLKLGRLLDQEQR